MTAFTDDWKHAMALVTDLAELLLNAYFNTTPCLLFRIKMCYGLLRDGMNGDQYSLPRCNVSGKTLAARRMRGESMHVTLYVRGGLVRHSDMQLN